MSKPALSKTELVELLETLSERLQRRRAVARLYVIGGACMALAYGRGRSTEDIDARIDTGHGALTEAVHEIARERGLPPGWLNEQATSAIPRGPDRRARTLYESPTCGAGATAEPDCGRRSAEEVRVDGAKRRVALGGDAGAHEEPASITGRRIRRELLVAGCGGPA